MRPFRLIPLLLALAVPLLPPAVASGSTISLTLGEEEVPKGPPVKVATVLWQAAPGEVNAGELDSSAGVVAVRGTGAPIAPGSGCAATADGWVTCSLGAGPRNTTIRVDLGDGDDTLLAKGADGHPLVLSGGAGADRSPTTCSTAAPAATRPTPRSGGSRSPSTSRPAAAAAPASATR
ncbi:hypothetical protein VSS74_00055 [Conexibacter stalactiti]|uniref:DUF11 domain-containing protein n=1 Tax=Conexibacter stalactiti TaxID=1940611 RepID=A0ABU4HHC2_9ACTN|nr:hypothetical protein [Conexibacter stalactiti]MDW5592706.1 hypothetical protein [Conexibacter stalactiti]MEC5033347.1 hypothetical protein [Conexibacter stalactiti]